MAKPYTDPETDPSDEQLLVAVYKELLEIKDIVLDLQQRQKSMETRQQTIKEEIEEAPAAQPLGSFATGYQKEKEK